MSRPRAFKNGNQSATVSIVESVGNVYTVPFKTNATFEPGTPRELFAGRRRLCPMVGKPEVGL